MAEFAEYAALARQLHRALHDGRREATETAERGRAARVAADQLEARLTAQAHRLAGLAHAIGQPPPGPLAAAAVYPTTVHPAAPPSTAYPAGSPTGHVPVPPGGQVPLPGAPGAALPAGGAYPPGGPPPTGGALALPGTGGAGAIVPGQRAGESTRSVTPASPVTAAAGRPADPLAELAAGREAADAADAAMTEAELAASRPALLPTWSPAARAFTVYAVFAALVGVVHWILLIVNGITRDPLARTDFGDLFTLFAWSCAGIPTMAFFAAYLVLHVWGRPPIGSGDNRQYARPGFLICFLAAPLASCGYYLLG